MAYFPNLSILPSGEFIKSPSDVAKTAELRSKTDAGYVITRRRFTRVPSVYSFDYWPLSNDDYIILDAFIEAVGITESFNWVHPLLKTVHTVRFLKRPKLIYADTHWRTSIELEEV